MKDASKEGVELREATPGCECLMCAMLRLREEMLRSADEMLAAGSPEASSAMMAAAERLGELLLKAQQMKRAQQEQGVEVLVKAFGLKLPPPAAPGGN